MARHDYIGIRYASIHIEHTEFTCQPLYARAHSFDRVCVCVWIISIACATMWMVNLFLSFSANFNWDQSIQFECACYQKLRHFSISNAWAGNCPPPLLIVRLFIVPFTIKRILKWLHSIISLECRYFAGISDNFEYNYIIAWCFLSSRNNHTATSKHYVDKINARFETGTKKKRTEILRIHSNCIS